MIEAQGLSKFYGGFAAIQDVSFKINRGEVVAFSRSQRRGEEHDDEGTHRVSGGVGRGCVYRRAQHGNRPVRRLGGSGIPAGKRAPLRRYDAQSAPRILRDGTRAVGLSSPGTNFRGGRVVCVRERDRQAGREALARLSPASGHGAGAAPRTGGAHSGRADGRARPEPDSRRPRGRFAVWAKSGRFSFRRTSCRKSKPWRRGRSSLPKAASSTTVR